MGLGTHIRPDPRHTLGGEGSVVTVSYHHIQAVINQRPLDDAGRKHEPIDDGGCLIKLEIWYIFHLARSSHLRLYFLVSAILHTILRV